MIAAFGGYRQVPALLALLGATLGLAPLPASAQTAEERARMEAFQKQIQERMALTQEARAEALARAQEHFQQAREVRAEALVRVEEQLRRAQEVRGEALAHAELQLHQAMERAQEHFQQSHETQAEALVRVEEQLRRVREQREEALARAEVQLQEARERAGEARARSAERLRDLQQVVIRTRARLRLGLSFSGTQPEEIDRQGARVQSVLEGSPAREAGLRQGDIITHLNGQSILVPIPDEAEKDFNDDESLPVQRLIALARDLEEGDEVEVRYLRDGASDTATFEAADMEEPVITISRPGVWDSMRVFRLDPGDSLRWQFAFPDTGAFHFSIPDLERIRGLDVEVPELYFRGPGEGRLRGLYFGEPGQGTGVWSMVTGTGVRGLHLAELNPSLGEYFSTQTGALVLEVEEDSALGLVPGDVIQAVDGRSVEDPSDVRRILGSYEEGEAVTFTVLRHGREVRVEGKVE